MRTDAIPDLPVPLTAELADEMLQRRLKKHHVAIILLHWFNASTWIAELATGAALILARHFRFAPMGYVRLLEGVFGSRANLLQFHIGLGLTWIFVFLVYGTFGWRTYLGREVIHREMILDRDDWTWLRVRVLLILHRTRESLPPQGVYNAGQKMFGWLVYAMIPVVMLSGVVMAFRLFGPAFVGWAVVAHFAAVGGVVSGLMIHLYMGAVFPEEKPAFFSMFNGAVDELYAYRHHFKWWREMQISEQAWMKRTADGTAKHAPAPAPAARSATEPAASPEDPPAPPPR